MPINRRQFELGINDELQLIMEGVQKILSINRKQAFSLYDLFAIKELNLDKDSSRDRDNLLYALKILEDLLAVETRLVHRTPYYATTGRIYDPTTWKILSS